MKVFLILSSSIKIPCSQNLLDTKSTKKHSKSNKRMRFVLARKSSTVVLLLTIFDLLYLCAMSNVYENKICIN